jgi:hypothetical protein
VNPTNPQILVLGARRDAIGLADFPELLLTIMSAGFLLPPRHVYKWACPTRASNAFADLPGNFQFPGVDYWPVKSGLQC